MDWLISIDSGKLRSHKVGETHWIGVARSHNQLHRSPVDLVIREIHVGNRLTIQSPISSSSDNSHDLPGLFTEGQMLADWILTLKFFVREALVDDDYLRGALHIALIKIATGSERNAHRLEIIGTDLIHLHRFLTLCRDWRMFGYRIVS